MIILKVFSVILSCHRNEISDVCLVKSYCIHFEYMYIHDVTRWSFLQ